MEPTYEKAKIYCPECGSTGPITECMSMRTAMYFAPVWVDGVNTNPDRNITTTYYNCGTCHHNFTLQS